MQKGYGIIHHVHCTVIVPFVRYVSLLTHHQADMWYHPTRSFYLLPFIFLDLTLEIFNKCRLRQRILPLASQREFVLLYNGVYPPDSVVVCSKSNTSSEFNQKSTKKTKPRRSKSGTEGKIVPSATPDSAVNVLANSEGRGGSESGCRLTTSPLHPSCPSVHTVKNKNPRPRVELKPNKCTLHQNLKAPDGAAECSKTQRKMRMIKSLPSPALSEGISICSLETTTSLPPPDAPPVWGNKRRGEDPDKDELRRGHKELWCII